jgi:hypothetical protein
MKDPDLISDTGDSTQQIVKLKNNLSQFNEQFKFNNNVKVLPCNNQIKELHTVLRDV